MKASVECQRRSPLRHSTMPEFFSESNISCKRRTNLFKQVGPERFDDFDVDVDLDVIEGSCM